MHKLISSVILFIVLTIGAGWYWFSPSAVLKRDFGALLSSVSNAVTTQDRVQIKSRLDSLFTDSAEIILEVDYPTARGQQAQIGAAENFTKPDFLRFVDNTLYTLSDYGITENVMSLESDIIHFGGHATAKGSQMDGNIRFIGDTACKARTLRETSKALKISKLSCVVQLRYGLAK